jgi:hypothetical protein
VLTGSATTGLGVGLAVRGQLAAGIALAMGAQLLLDPGLRMLLLHPWVSVATTALVGGALFGWLAVQANRPPRAVSRPPIADSR